MTFEEWKEKYSDLIENVAITFFNYGRGVATKTCYDELEYLLKKAFNAGKTKWHKVADGDLPKGEKSGRDGVHRYIYLKDRYGKLYTGNYFPKDENHEEDCFSVEILDWGFRGSQFCKKEQISEWCEIPQYTEE